MVCRVCTGASTNYGPHQPIEKIRKLTLLGQWQRTCSSAVGSPFDFSALTLHTSSKPLDLMAVDIVLQAHDPSRLNMVYAIVAFTS